MVADGVVDEFGDGVKVELDHDVGAVSFGGIDADAEEVGDFLVGFAFGEELKDFAFARGESAASGFRSVRGGSGGGGIVNGSGEAGREVGLVLAGGFNGGEEDAVGVVLEDVAAGTGLDDLLNEVVGFVHGENEDFGGGRGETNLPCGFDAVEERHADVEDGDVRFELGGFVDGIAAVGGFGADLPAGARLEEGAQTGTNDGVVIRDQDAKNGHQQAPSEGAEEG